MMDNSLNIVQNFTFADDNKGDVHEFKIINGTVLYTFYYPFPMNLSRWGGPVDGYVVGSGFRHVDLETRRIILEWICTDYISPNDTFTWPGGQFGDGTAVATGGTGPWDYLHLNSVDMHPSDGTFLSTNTSKVVNST